MLQKAVFCDVKDGLLQRIDYQLVTQVVTGIVILRGCMPYCKGFQDRLLSAFAWNFSEFTIKRSCVPVPISPVSS